MSSENQVRITVPAWAVQLHGWSKDSNLVLTAITEKDDKPITERTIIVLKEVRKNAKRE